MPGIKRRVIRETPITVIDFETTGLYPGSDRVVEVTVVRTEPGEQPKVVFDTLINPNRKMKATDIHGITDEDVQNAPLFEDIAGDFLQAIEGSVVSAYNVYFDLKFLIGEFDRLGVDIDTPHFCLMYMRPMLGLGGRCKLIQACEENGIDLGSAHTAADDAMATAKLFQAYQEVLDTKGIATFGDMQRRSSYKFLKSFDSDPLKGASQFNLAPSGKSFSRSGHMVEIVLTDEQKAIRAYWDIIKSVVADLEATDEEVEYAVSERKKLGLTKEQIRFLHARAFAAAIHQFIDDQHLDDSEVRKLRKLHKALSRMGWAPGG